MKKFLTVIMSLLLVGLTCILIYTAFNRNSLDLYWNKGILSSAVPQEVPAVSAPPRSQGTSAQEVIPNDDGGGNRLPVSQTIAPASPSYSFLRQHSGLDCLTDSGSRKLYDEMLQTAYTVMVKPDKDGFYPTNPITVKKQKLTENQIRMAVLAFRNDNPQIFWLTNRYSYSNDSDTVVKLYSYIPANQCNILIKKLNSAISKSIGAVPPGLSELDREIFIFQMIAQMCSYDDAAVSNTKLWLPHTAVGTLVEGKAVCEGYSRAMQLLSSYCGLDCQPVNGEGNGAAHMWNLIQIDGSWYHLDPTWSDGTVPSYNYFNVTDGVIRADHSISADLSLLNEEQVKIKDAKPADYNLTLPDCNAVEANYFRAKGIHIRDFGSANNSEAVQSVAEAAKIRSSSIVFYIEDSMDYKQTIRKMVKASPYQLSYYLNMANRAMDGSTAIDINNIRYSEAENNRGLTVILSYK